GLSRRQCRRVGAACGWQVGESEAAAGKQGPVRAKRASCEDDGTRGPLRMDLILWRHCEAEPGEPDLGRRLTSKGLKQAERMAARLDATLPDTRRVLGSPADRR